MLQLSIIDPYDSERTFRTLYPLELNRGGIFEPKLKMDINEYYQITMKIDPNIGDERWRLLRSNFHLGIRLRTDTQDLAFVKIRQPQFDSNNGEISLGFGSSVYLLKDSEPKNLLRVYNGSAAQLLGGLDDRFVFQLIGDDLDLVAFTCGSSDNYDLLNQICSQVGWSWRENGLVNVGTDEDPKYKTKIDVGNFEQLGNFYANGIEGRYKTNTIRQTETTNRPNALQEDQIVINRVKLNYSGGSLTHLYTYFDTSSGASESTIIEFESTDVGASWIDARFPLVPFTSSVTGKVKYFIVNQIAKLRGDPDKFEIRPYTSTANAQDETGAQDIDIEQAKRSMYRSSVEFLKRQTDNQKYSYDLTYKKIILPSNLAKIRYKETQKTLRGETLTIFDIDETILLRDLSFDLGEIRN